ncbi:MAG TPA: hypothetical protein VHK88_17150, partial [Aquihabitans sp.]|nr:hypothetical protein [Aquihabitans sp.]
MGRVRSAVPRSRLPLHRRPFADPAALRRWALVAALAIVTTALVSHALSGAEDARRRWGETRTVLVVDRAVAAGDPLAGAVARRVWPVGLVPAGAVVVLPDGAEAAGAAGAGTPLTDALVARPGAGRADGRRRIAIA